MRARARASAAPVSPDGGDDQVLGVVGAAGGAQFAEHGVRVIEEVFVDGYLHAVEFGHPGLLPAGGIRVAAGFAAAEDQQVGDDCGACCALVRAAGQRDRAGQVGQGPCQALADYLTLLERFGDVKNICLAYVGDGNNVAHSLLLTCACLGSSIRIATPPGYEPNSQIVADAREIAQETGAEIQLLTDPHEAVAGADAIYTDAWTSMGQEKKRNERARIFPPYQVNRESHGGSRAPRGIHALSAGAPRR